VERGKFHYWHGRHGGDCADIHEKIEGQNHQAQNEMFLQPTQCVKINALTGGIDEQLVESRGSKRCAKRKKSGDIEEKAKTHFGEFGKGERTPAGQGEQYDEQESDIGRLDVVN
jgi:hypothetical protein